MERAHTSDEMISAYEEVQSIPPDLDHPDVESAVAEILVYLDATQLAQFGTASAYPAYVFFGNLKIHSLPTRFPCSSSWSLLP
jgi:hypothetical protein